MTKKEPAVVLIPELAGAIGLRQLSDEQIKKFKNNPENYLDEIDLIPAGKVSVIAVENTATEVHLTLPFYAELDKIQASTITDDNMEAAGGEIVTLLFFTAVAGAIGGGAYYIANKGRQQGRNAVYQVFTGEDAPPEGK